MIRAKVAVDSGSNMNNFHCLLFQHSYPSRGYRTRVNYYSGLDLTFEGASTGNADNNNAALLTERRFMMSNVGQEEYACY
jgi:hypothetical protein